MADKFIPIKTSKDGDVWQIYKLDYAVPEEDSWMYRRYDDEGIIIYKSYEACKRKVDLLNNEYV